MTKRTLSTQAQAAKRIRTDLKRAFPGVKFSVKSDSFAGGDAVRINWIDGPTTSQVDALTNQYQYGSFDGMIDLYENTNSRKDIPQTKYVQTSRGYSDERHLEALAYLNKRYGVDLETNERGHIHHNARLFDTWATTYAYGHMAKQSMVCTCGTDPVLGDAYCGECGQPLQDDERRRAEYEKEEAQEAGIDAYLHTILK